MDQLKHTVMGSEIVLYAHLAVAKEQMYTGNSSGDEGLFFLSVLE